MSEDNEADRYEAQQRGLPADARAANKMFYDDSPRPIPRERWEAIRNRVVDELVKGKGKTLCDLAEASEIEVGRLEVWLKSPDGFRPYGRRIGEKSQEEIIAEKLEKRLDELDAVGRKASERCPVRVKTSVTRASIAGIATARSMCEFVPIDAPVGTGKTEAGKEYIAQATKAEGFGCPVWQITLDESCISMKAVLLLLARKIVGAGRFDERTEFAMSQAIIEAAEGRGGVLLVDEGQHLADAQKKMGIPIINLLRSFVDRGLFGIAYFGNGEVYRRLTAGSGKDKGAYTQLLSRMQDFRVEIMGLGKGGKNLPALTKVDVLAVAAAWGVSGVEEEAYCLKVAALPGALRAMTNIFRKALEDYGVIDMTAINKVRRL